MTVAVDVNAAAIPDELTKRDQWVCWKVDTRNGKPTKVPMQPDGSGKAKSNDMATWGTFEQVLTTAKGRKDWGVGFMFSDADPYLGIDLDGCVRHNNDRPKPKEWLPSLDVFSGTYSEFSPSGDGLHVILKDVDLPEWWTNQKQKVDGAENGIEVYDSARYFTFTGDAHNAADVGTVDGLEGWLLDGWEVFNDELPQSFKDAGDETGDSDVLADIGVYDVVSRQSHPENKRSEHPFHGSETGANFFVNDGGETFRCWRHEATGNGLHLLGIETGVISCGEWDGTGLESDTWKEIFDQAREAGYEIPNPATTDGGTTTANTPKPVNDGASTDDGNDDSEPVDLLTPGTVCATAGLGEDENVVDLDDREKAACVWSLLWRSDEYHVRVRRDNGGIWAYDDGVWTTEGERILRHAGRKALGPMNYGANVLAELKAQARSDPRAEVAGDAFGVDPGTVALENGLLDLEAAATGEDALRDLRPDDYALARLPVEYDRNARCAEWEELVDEWAEEGKADALQEFVGYCLHIGALPIHRVLLLVGSGANGKSVFLHTVRSLLGDENTAEIGVQTLANEENAVADFYGKLANIDDDLSSRKLGAGLGMFKKLSAGNPVRARQLYGEGFSFDATGKQLYSANEVPDVDVGDDDEAFWRRWLLVEFPNHYAPAERDTTLKDRLSAPGVLSGVLNWAIDGWHRLICEGDDYFTNEERYAVDKRERWQSWGDSINKFLTECVERDDDAENITTGDVHRVYAAWCRETGEVPASQQALTNQLKGKGLGYGKSVRVNGSVQRGYKSISFTDDVPNLDDTPARGGQQSGFEQHGE